MESFDDTIGRFCERYDVNQLIAVSGTARPDPKAEAETIAFVEHMARIPGVALVTSGTKEGVPARALETADRLGVRVIRVFPSYARQKHLLALPADLEVSINPMVTQSEWGDETPVFMKLAHGVVFIGGAAGTFLEMGYWAKLNQTRFRRRIPLVPAVPLCGVGGFSQWLADEGPRLFAEFYADAAPLIPITSGQEAAVWLLGEG